MNKFISPEYESEEIKDADLSDQEQDDKERQVSFAKGISELKRQLSISKKLVLFIPSYFLSLNFCIIKFASSLKLCIVDWFIEFDLELGDEPSKKRGGNANTDGYIPPMNTVKGLDDREMEPLDFDKVEYLPYQESQETQSTFDEIKKEEDALSPINFEEKKE